MDHIENFGVLFVTWIYSPSSRDNVKLLIKSIRSFGGRLSNTFVWVFEPDAHQSFADSLEAENIRVFPLDTPADVRRYNYAHKVFACAQMEEMAPDGVNSIVWMSPEILVLQPPELFQLAGDCDAAVRPVHIQNVGLKVSRALDRFWSGVYQAVGVKDVSRTVESFVDRQHLRAYFNSAAFAVNPKLGLCQQWFELYRSLVLDKEFQETACGDDWHQVFLHQAVLSALLVSEIPTGRLRILPPAYIYPYNLHADVPPERKAYSLEELVCIYHEGRELAPEHIEDIEVSQQLRSWLHQNVISKTD